MEGGVYSFHIHLYVVRPSINYILISERGWGGGGGRGVSNMRRWADQSESLLGALRIGKDPSFLQTMLTQIGLHGCAGQSESLLGMHVIRSIFSHCISNLIVLKII